MTAQGKTTASALAARIDAGEPVRILAGLTEDGRVYPAAKVTGSIITTVTAVRVEHTTGHGFRQRSVRHYVFTTPHGEFSLIAHTTLTLAPETPAAVKRAHAEAIAEDGERAAQAVVVEVVADQEPADQDALEELVAEELDRDRRELGLASGQGEPGKATLAAAQERARLADAKLDAAVLEDYQAAVAELDAGQRASLAAGSPVVVTDQAQAERVVDALLGIGSGSVMAGGQDVPTTVQVLDPAELEDPARVERVSESLTVQVRDPEARVVEGDVVRIHRGTRLYEVVRVERDMARDATKPDSQWEDMSMARLIPCDPEDDRDPGWVSLDLLHRVPPVARVRTVMVQERQELSDDLVAVAGTGWDPARGVLRQPAVVYSSGSRPPLALLLPVDPETEARSGRPVGCLRIGDALVVNDRAHQVVWDGGPAEPRLEGRRLRDR
jgi:hypothetical protein